ncbi:dienelactone hydrolase [Caldicoprobacter guelmensis]|uniref:dienelactone hydrolase family protein n=1 Tax=Caldicoprobacter guelmensis TaxID=1170224 RepID=UPI0019574189|nr:alpha/beta hydrolase family protein [Caldicoprobacter guelmensis]MBM7581919.1 dienelactone hydrolase [Caldicoprobacter guelmensis]
MAVRPDKFLEKMYNMTVPKYEFNARNIDEWRMWRNDLKKVFIECLGGLPEGKVDLNPQIVEQKELDDYVRQRVVFNTLEDLEMLAYVLIPKNIKGKLPAVVACHGHGYGSKDIVGLNFDGSEKTGDIGYQKNFAVELVKRGFLVIAPELIGFGDRTLEEDAAKAYKGESSCYKISINLLMMGKTMAGIRVYEVMRTIDYLLTHSEVDPDRIGCMGISGGGLVCAFTSALDERIKAAVISGYANTFKDSVMSIYHCIDNFIPGIIQYAEMPDIIGLIAPRPLLIESGTQDPIFPIEATRKAFAKLEKIYEVLGAREKLDKDFFEGQHQISGRKAYQWLLKWL